MKPREKQDVHSEGNTAVAGAQRAIGRRRRWLFRIAAVLIGLAPLVMFELAVRLAAPRPTEAVDFDPVVDLSQLRPLFVHDRQTDRWRIPPERMNFFRPASFPDEKPSETRRVFVLGGSTVQGRPYATETSFATWLRLRLEACRPETNFEVINCGGVSYAAYRVAEILREVLGHQPDAIVLYTGHNEFLEDRTYAHVRSLTPLRRWTSRVSSHLRSVRWLKHKLSNPPSDRTKLPWEVDARLDHVAGLDRYHRDPEWRRGVEAHFDLALRRMVGLTQDAGVPLILCVPAGELVQTPPFKIETAPQLSTAQRQSFQQAWRTVRDTTANHSERLAACRQTLQIDPAHAGVHYVTGQLLLRDDRLDPAIEHLTAARDHDVCPLRATSPIVESVRKIAAQHDLPLVDTIDLLDRTGLEESPLPDGVADPESFIDHVHPTIAGHQRIAAALAEEFEKLGWISPSATTERRYEQLVREQMSGLSETYFQTGKQRLEGLRRWAAGRAAEVGTSRPDAGRSGTVQK